MSGLYDEQFAASYEVRAPGLPGDVDFYLRLAREAHAAGQAVLELACGTGRVAVPIAREGVSVVGLDFSPAMLDRAREKSADVSTVRWVEGDMRSFELPERFGLVFIPYRSFLHLLTVEDQLSCLGCCYRHLVPGGRLALNVFNPDIVVMGQWLSSGRGGLQRRGGFRDPGTRRRVEWWETREYRPANQDVLTTWLEDELSDDGAVVSRVYRTLKLRYVFRYEMEHLLERSGFKVEALHGDFFGGAFEDSSSEMVWLARRPA